MEYFLLQVLTQDLTKFTSAKFKKNVLSKVYHIKKFKDYGADLTVDQAHY